MTNVKSLPGLKELKCIKHHISSDNPANWKEDINNTFIVVFNYIGYLINQRCKKYWKWVNHSGKEEIHCTASLGWQSLYGGTWCL